MLKIKDFFDISEFEYARLFDGVDYIWDVLKKLPQFVDENMKVKMNGKVISSAYFEQDVSIGTGTIIEPYAVIKGPVIIGSDCVIGNSAFIRGPAIIGDRSIVGHATELKHSILLNDVEAPHFSYIGDSILGNYVHLGAGVKISNFKITKTPVKVKINDKQYETGLLKFGAILGDKVEIGCNSVLNPGTVIGKNTLCYANISLKGYYPPNSIIKLIQTHEIINRKN